MYERAREKDRNKYYRNRVWRVRDLPRENNKFLAKKHSCFRTHAVQFTGTHKVFMSSILVCAQGTMEYARRKISPISIPVYVGFTMSILNTY